MAPRTSKVPKELLPHVQILKVLARSKPHVLKNQIDQLSPAVLRAIKNISKNTISGNVTLTKAQKTKLRKHNQELKELAKSRTSLRRTKTILQEGGFLGALLTPLVGIISKLLLN
jgi:hypothetical protein